MSVLAEIAIRSRSGRSAGRRRLGPLEGFEAQIAVGADDAVEYLNTGVVTLNAAANHLPLGYDASVGGTIPEMATLIALRFPGATLDQGTPISLARLRFVASNGNAAPVVLRVWCEAADNSAAITTTSGSLSSREKTTAYLDWSPSPWGVGQDDEATRTDELAPLVQEVVNRAGWQAGNALTFLVELSPANTDTEAPRRRARAYEVNPDDAARVFINTITAPTPVEPDPDPDPPAGGDLEMRGDPSFTVSSLDDTVTDGMGVTQRGWYDRMMNSLALGNFDSEFDRHDTRPWNRTGQVMATAYLIAFRYTGHLHLLDEAVRLMELAYARLQATPYDSNFTRWATNDQDLDVPLAVGYMACVMWAAHNNRDLTSPAGYNYGAIADAYYAWFCDDFFQRNEPASFAGQDKWVQNSGNLPNILKWQQHTVVNNMRLCWYMNRMGGLPAASGRTFTWTAGQFRDAVTSMLTTKWGQHVTGGIGHNGRTVVVYPHSANNTTRTGSSGSLQYSTYVRYEVTALLDLMLDGADAVLVGEGATSRLNDTFFTYWANSWSDLVCDGDPNGTGVPFASDIGGGHGVTEPGPLGFDHNSFRSRSDASTQVRFGGAAFLSGWDSRERILSYMGAYYPVSGTAATPDRPAFAASRVFTSFYHGLGE